MAANEWDTLSEMESQPRRILVADDDEATRILLRVALTQWGYEVIEAKDGEEAWQVLKESDPPQILTLDWLMPKLDGISLCKRIQNELNYHPYIIFLTRMTGADNLIRGLEAGADEFMLKPFDLAELRIRVFAGERIINYRHHISEQNKQLKGYITKMKSLVEEQAKKALPSLEIGRLLQQIQQALTKVIASLSEDKVKNTPALNQLQELQSSLNNITEVIKGSQNDTKTISSKRVDRSELDISIPRTIVDMKRMHAFFGNDIAAIHDFIKTFISLSSEQLRQIEIAIKEKDVKTGEYFFHLLGGACGNSGMTKMYELCGKAEENILIPDWDVVNEVYLALKAMVEKLRVEMPELK